MPWLLTVNLKQLIDLLNGFSCNIESTECMNNLRESYPKYHVNEDNFEEDVESSADTDESDSSNRGNHSIIYYKWMTINGKTSKVIVSLSFSDVLGTVKEKINELKYHALREKCPNTEFFLVRIFPYSD